MIIEIYTSSTCANCLRAKRYLDNEKIEYFERNIEEQEHMDDLIVRTGLRSVPQIFINSAHIGGYEEMMRFV